MDSDQSRCTDRGSNAFARLGPDPDSDPDLDRLSSELSPDPEPGRSAADRALAARLVAGDEAAFRALVAEYHRPLLRFALGFTPRRELAEDIVQESWLGLLRGLDRFEGRSSLRTWLYQICANRARSMARREARVVPMDPPGPEGWAALAAVGAAVGAAPEVEPDAADRLAAADERAQLAARVRAAIDRLPEGQRRVVTLRDVAGLSAPQVCAMLAITEANQRVLLHRGRSRVRALVAPVAAAN